MTTAARSLCWLLVEYCVLALLPLSRCCASSGLYRHEDEQWPSTLYPRVKRCRTKACCPFVLRFTRNLWALKKSFKKTFRTVIRKPWSWFESVIYSAPAFYPFFYSSIHFAALRSSSINHMSKVRKVNGSSTDPRRMWENHRCKRLRTPGRLCKKL